VEEGRGGSLPQGGGDEEEGGREEGQEQEEEEEGVVGHLGEGRLVLMSDGASGLGWSGARSAWWSLCL